MTRPTATGPLPRSYDDLLANDNSMFIGYRHAPREHGVFELPLALKRSHVSYAHTDADIDRLIEGTHRAVASVLADGGWMMTGASSTMGGVTA